MGKRANRAENPARRLAAGAGDGGKVDALLLGEPLTQRLQQLVETAQGTMRIDIRFRMLKPHELAAAMSFDSSYKFSGNREEQVRQIGNAVPVCLGQALCEAALA